MWIGRGDAEPLEWENAVQLARDLKQGPTPRYLLDAICSGAPAGGGTLAGRGSPVGRRASDRPKPLEHEQQRSRCGAIALSAARAAAPEQQATKLGRRRGADRGCDWVKPKNQIACEALSGF